jgi:hypothetical protein
VSLIGSRRIALAFLRFAAAQVRPQRRRKPRVAARRLSGLLVILALAGHGFIIGQTRGIASSAQKQPLPCADRGRYGSFRRVRAARHGPRAFRCRSSVVEHPLGKGEVECSIHSGSTTKLHKFWLFYQAPKSHSATTGRTKREDDSLTRGESVDFVHAAFRVNFHPCSPRIEVIGPEYGRQAVDSNPTIARSSPYF